MPFAAMLSESEADWPVMQVTDLGRASADQRPRFEFGG